MIYETPQLETERLILKRGTLEDLQKVYEYNFLKLRDIAGEFIFEKQDPKKIEGFEIVEPDMKIYYVDMTKATLNLRQ